MRVNHVHVHNPGRHKRNAIVLYSRGASSTKCSQSASIWQPTLVKSDEVRKDIGDSPVMPSKKDMTEHPTARLVSSPNSL